MKLKTIKKYADLLEFKNIEILKNMIEKYNRALAEIDNRLDTGQNQKKPLDKESFGRILNFRLLQRSLIRNEFVEFKRFVELRAYAELDYKELTEVIIKYVNSTTFDITKLNDTLDFPDIKINLKSTVVPITVKYSLPINRLICFSNKGVKVY
jgi:ribosomal protein S18